MEKEKKTEMAFLEAPASWNVKIISPQGFSCMLTLRCTSGMELLAKADSALAYLLERGYLPDPGYRKNGNSDTKTCSIHHVEMRKFEKDGHSWYSHKLEGDRWCNGKPQKKVGSNE